MTTLHDLTARQLGLAARGCDKERQSLVKIKERGVAPDKEPQLQADIDDLERAGTLLKQAESKLLFSE